MEGPCMPPYAMGTDVINFYLYCLFSPLNTAQKWMFIDISESFFLPTKLLQIWSKMSHFFLRLPLSLTTQSVLNPSFFLIFPFKHLLNLSFSLSMFKSQQVKERVTQGLFSRPHFPQAIVFALWFFYYYYCTKCVFKKCGGELGMNGCTDAEFSITAPSQKFLLFHSLFPSVSIWGRAEKWPVTAVSYQCKTIFEALRWVTLCRTYLQTL